MPSQYYWQQTQPFPLLTFSWTVLFLHPPPAFWRITAAGGLAQDVSRDCKRNLKHPFSPLSAQGILFCTGECLKAPLDLLKIYLHESSRVYRDKLVEEQDFQLFDKLQTDTVKKFYEVRAFAKF